MAKRLSLLFLSFGIVVAFLAGCAAPSIERVEKAPSTEDHQSQIGARDGKPAAPTTLQADQAAAPAQATVPWDRMIIRSANLSLVVKDVEASLATVRDLATGFGGFVAQSNSRYDRENQLATITIQVAASKFDAAMAAVRQLAVKVESETGASQDVTEEFTDLEAQVRNLLATEASLQRLMDKATRMEDILVLQRELTAVRGEIEKRQGRLNFLNRRAQMATITVALRPESMVKSTQARPGWQPLETVRRAWEASAALLTTIADVVIAVLVFLWWTVPLLLLGLYLWRIRRWHQQRTAG